MLRKPRIRALRPRPLRAKPESDEIGPDEQPWAGGIRFRVGEEAIEVVADTDELRVVTVWRKGQMR